MATKALPSNTPFVNKISFRKIIEDLERQASGSNTIKASYAQQVLKEIEPYPILREGFEDQSLLQKYKPQIDLLLEDLFPDILTKNEIKAAIPPMEFYPIKLSSRLQQIIANAGGEFNFDKETIDPKVMYVMQCSMILAFYYGYKVDMQRSLISEIPDLKDGVTKHYKVTFNADMFEIEPTENAVPITEEDYLTLIENFHNTELWEEKFPPQSYIIRGLGIISLTDVSVEQSLANLTTNLLQRDHDSLDMIQGNLRQLYRVSDLQVRLMIVEGQYLNTKPGRWQSLAMGGKDRAYSQETFCPLSYGLLMVKHQPVSIIDIDKYGGLSDSLIAKGLKDSKMGSYVAYPLVYNGKLSAILEIASPRKYELNSGSILKLEKIIPLLSLSAHQFSEEKQIRMEAIIQEECTTIHSSVKWRFEEEALAYMEKRASDPEAQFSDITFKDIYPFFGQLDIRGSSVLRNKAVQADLGRQLVCVSEVLKMAIQSHNLPIYEKLHHRVNIFAKELGAGLQAGSEHQILNYLKANIYPVFDHLKTVSPVLEKEIDQFYSQLDPELNIIYDKRKDFDESVMRTNHALANFLDKKQDEAQSMFPHYFDRYKTDGVEFNMYIGESIAQHHHFDPIYLSNLKLWQLIVMCEMEQEFSQLKQNLKTPLEVASLILVNNSPLSIHFRMDEKRFDVDGAYNARYEIIKKRVDKATIKGTGQRLTEPGKISIIYTSSEDIQEYLGFVDFLQFKGLLESGDPELLELDELPGVTGLKALRVSVKYDNSIPGESISLNEIREVVEGL